MMTGESVSLAASMIALNLLHVVDVERRIAA